MRIAPPLVLIALTASAAVAAPKVSRPAVSAVAEFSKTGYDELAFLGWNDACSCALRYLSHPPAGEDFQALPTSWRIGALTIDPESRSESEVWLYQTNQEGWEPGRAAVAAERLRDAGYSRKGLVETIRPDPAAPRPGLDLSIHSPNSLGKGQKVAWPKGGYSLRQVFYSPLAVCALAVFRDEARPRDSYRWKLLRLMDPTARLSRGRSHLDNALLLYDSADIYSAVEEAQISAAMTPESASARYNYARMLAIHGRLDEALAELEAAIRLEPARKKRAKKTIEFKSLFGDLRFQSLVLP